MVSDQEILQLAQQNQQQAQDVIAQSGVLDCWQSIGAKINLIGSLKTGLLMTHRDIDFHIYTPKLEIRSSFAAMERLAENPQIVKIEYTNLSAEADACLEWHALYRDNSQNLWQIDMIHMAQGSIYDGYFEKIADRICQTITDKQRMIILRLKYETPASLKIAGIEYYMAVMRDGIENYDQFTHWRQQNPLNGIIEWIP